MAGLTGRPVDFSPHGPGCNGRAGRSFQDPGLLARCSPWNAGPSELKKSHARSLQGPGTDRSGGQRDHESETGLEPAPGSEGLEGTAPQRPLLSPGSKVLGKGRPRVARLLCLKEATHWGFQVKCPQGSAANSNNRCVHVHIILAKRHILSGESCWVPFASSINHFTI